MPRQLKGTFQDYRATQLFHLINLTKRTGTLHVYEPVKTGREIVLGDGMTKRPELVPGKERAVVTVKDGKLTFAAATDQDNHLSTTLYKAGRLTEQQYRVIREKTANYNDRALALLLINHNYQTQAEIVQAIQQQMLKVVYDVMTWITEPFVFTEDEQPPPERITVPTDLGEVVREGTRRGKDGEILLREFPDLNVRLKFPATAPTDKLRQTKLTRQEWNVLQFVDGQNSMRQIAKSANLSDTEIRRIVYGLVNSGLVEVVKLAQVVKPPVSVGHGQQPPLVDPAAPRLPSRDVIMRTIRRIQGIGDSAAGTR